MRMGKLLVWGLGIIVWGMAGQTAAAETPPPPSGKTVCLVTGNDYPPFCFSRPQNARAVTAADKTDQLESVAPGKNSQRIQGYAWDMVRAAFHSQGYSIMLRTLSWREAAARAKGAANEENIGGTRARQSDYTVNLNWGNDTYFKFNERDYGVKGGTRYVALLFPVVRTPERDQVYAYSREPLFTSRLVAYMPQKSPITDVSPEALGGRKVGFLKEYSYGDLRQRYAAAKSMEVDNLEAGFNLLRSGRLEVMFGYESAFDYHLRKSHFGRLFRKISTPHTVAEYLCGLRSNDKTAEVLAVFDAGVRALTANGKARQIAEQWGIR